MISDRRLSLRGLYWAVTLLALLAVALPPQPLAAAWRTNGIASPRAAASGSFPTRLEGQLQSIDGSNWLVDQTPVALGANTSVIVKRGAAKVGAWVLVAGLQYPDRLEADTIEVLRPAGAAMPTHQVTGVLQKQKLTAWVIGETPVDITPDTRTVGDVVVDGLVCATVRRASHGYEALEIKAIAPDSASVPYAIEGTVEQVTDNSWVVDEHTILVPEQDATEAKQGDTVQVAAVSDKSGSLIAQQTQVVDNANDSRFDGYVTAVDGLGEDVQTWTLLVLNNGAMEQRSVRVRPDTYVDEDRTVIQPDVEAEVDGVTSGDASVDAARIQLEQPVPATAAGALAASSSHRLSLVGRQQVWFGSDELVKQAEATANHTATEAQLASPGTFGNIVVRGVRLRNGVLIAKEVFAPEAAAAAGVLATESGLITAGLTSFDAVDWYGPTGIESSLAEASKPTLLFDAKGGGHVVYESAGKIYYAYAPPGGPWREPQKIGTGLKPVAVFDASGQLHVAYTSEFMGNYDILHLRLTANGWTLPHVVAPTSGKSDDPAIAADSNGKIYVAWSDFTSGEWAIQIGTWDGSYWTSYPVPNARGQNPTLVVMPDAALFLAWQDRIPLGLDAWGNYDVFTSERSSTERSWSLPVNVSDNRMVRPGSNSLGARLAATSEPWAHVAWIDDTVQVRYVWGRGSYWPLPVDVTDRRPLARGLSMQMAADGLLYLAWDQGKSLLVGASPPRTQMWPDAITVAPHSLPETGEVLDVSLSVAGGGVAVSWVQQDLSGGMGVYEIRYNMTRDTTKNYLPLIMMP